MLFTISALKDSLRPGCATVLEIVGAKLSKTSQSGPEKGVITKGVLSLEESLESLKSLYSLEPLENGRILLCFP